jgi:hypothetical protein
MVCASATRMLPGQRRADGGASGHPGVMEGSVPLQMTTCQMARSAACHSRWEVKPQSSVFVLVFISIFPLYS